MLTKTIVIQCMTNHAVELSGESGPLEAAASDEVWESLAIKLSSEAPEIIANAIAVLKSQAQKKKALVMFAAILAVPAIDFTLAAISVPADGVGAKPKTGGDQKCDPNKKVDEDSPFCKDKDCDGDDENERCKTGPEKGCPCIIVGDTHKDEIDIEWADQQQKILDQIIAGVANPNPDLPEATCDKDEPKKFSAAIFNAGVYKTFCEDVSKDPKSVFAKIVDVHGNYISPKRAARRSLRAREDSVDLKPYEDYRFELDWSGGDGSCQSDCAKVYKAMSESACWHTAGDSNTLGIMAIEAKLDTGCGTYHYKIDIPPTPETPPPETEDPPPEEDPKITIQPGRCTTDPGNIKCWKDVHKEQVEETADEFPKHFNTMNSVMKPDTRNITQVLRKGGQSGSGVTYMMNIGWIPGCDIVKEQDARNPVPDDQSIGYRVLLTDNYYMCKSFRASAATVCCCGGEPFPKILFRGQ